MKELTSDTNPVVFIAGVTVARTVSGTATGRQALAGEMIED